MKNLLRTCLTCGVIFEAPQPNSKTCSDTCRRERYAKVRKMNRKGGSVRRGDGTEAMFIGMDCKICGRHLVREHAVTEFCAMDLERRTA